MYTAEYREEAVKLVLKEGLSIPEAAGRLSMPKQTLGHWVALARKGALVSVNAHRGSAVGELEAENTRLRRALAEVKLERDILKKATAYFARESLPGTRL